MAERGGILPCLIAVRFARFLSNGFGLVGPVGVVGGCEFVVGGCGFVVGGCEFVVGIGCVCV